MHAHFSRLSRAAEAFDSCPGCAAGASGVGEREAISRAMEVDYTGLRESEWALPIRSAARPVGLQ